MKQQTKKQPVCWIAGGETTVTVDNSDQAGKGGRNLELALAGLPVLAALPDAALISLATDGEDGPTDAAGAVVTGSSLQRAFDLDLDPRQSLQRHDSYPFFKTLDDLILTGPTRTNVNDLCFLFRF